MKIWCVEDDASIRDIEVYTLNSTGYTAQGFPDGASFWNALKQDTPALIILDIMLPEEDGIEILKKLKFSPQTRNIPVIMATAKGAEYDKIESLELGADDYLVKPFGIMEMVSRVKAVLRRCSANPISRLLKAGDLVLDLDKYMVMIEDKRIDLTFKEFELLRLLLSRPSNVFTREQIFSQVWGGDFVGETRTVDVHIRTLRQKLGKYGEKIKTVRNVGYRMEVSD